MSGWESNIARISVVPERPDPTKKGNVGGVASLVVT
jgi:hypothetical protein